MTGEPGDEVRSKVTEIKGREMLAIVPVVGLIIVLGFVPQVVLNVVNPAVDRNLVTVGVSDPPPQVTAAIQGGSK